MQALYIGEMGKLDSLSLQEVPCPNPQPTQIRVRVEAAGLNRADVLQALGQYPAPLGFNPNIPGLEYAGCVDSVGTSASRFRPGDRVMGLTGGAAFAEYLVVDENEAIPIPRKLSSTEASVLPEAFSTAFDALVLQAHLQQGDVVLIHALASGVGTAAAQLASCLGATVIGTTRTQAKSEWARAHGVEHVVACETRPPLFAQQVLEWTKKRGVNVVLDLLGGPYVAESIRCMAPKGRLMLVGLLAGRQGELPLGEILSRRLTVKGTVLRSRPLQEKIELSQAFHRTLCPLFENGVLQPVLDEVFPFSEFKQAFARLSGNQTIGKLALSWT